MTTDNWARRTDAGFVPVAMIVFWLPVMAVQLALTGRPVLTQVGVGVVGLVLAYFLTSWAEWSFARPPRQVPVDWSDSPSLRVVEAAESIFADVGSRAESIRAGKIGAGTVCVATGFESARHHPALVFMYPKNDKAPGSADNPVILGFLARTDDAQTIQVTWFPQRHVDVGSSVAVSTKASALELWEDLKIELDGRASVPVSLDNWCSFVLLTNLDLSGRVYLRTAARWPRRFSGRKYRISSAKRLSDS